MNATQSSPLYLFTVGTGTAGQYSNLAKGILNCILHFCPQKGRVGLIPSIDPNSEVLAELILEQLKEDRPDMEASLLARLSDPDDLLSCRREFRALLRSVRETSPAASVIVNPTSGTKQMTAAATLACLDEGMGQIEFITGERVDGVVKTGTERVSRVDAARLQAEQRIRDVWVLLDNGDYTAASTLAATTASVFPFAAAATAMLAAWNRFAYTDALRAASGHETLAGARQTLSRLREAAEISLDRAADMLELSQRELAFNRPEEALSAIYRTVELFAKVRLAELGCPPEQYFAEHLIKVLSPDSASASDLNALQRRADERGHGPIFIGLDRCLRLLRNHAFAFNDMSREHREILRARNETRFGHGGKCVPTDEVRRLFVSVCDRAANQWSELKALQAESVFPDLTTDIRKEMNHE